MLVTQKPAVAQDHEECSSACPEIHHSMIHGIFLSPIRCSKWKSHKMFSTLLALTIVACKFHYADKTVICITHEYPIRMLIYIYIYIYITSISYFLLKSIYSQGIGMVHSSPELRMTFNSNLKQLQQIPLSTYALNSTYNLSLLLIFIWNCEWDFTGWDWN
jgi:hypothetical protein